MNKIILIVLGGGGGGTGLILNCSNASPVRVLPYFLQLHKCSFRNERNWVSSIPFNYDYIPDDAFKEMHVQFQNTIWKKKMEVETQAI